MKKIYNNTPRLYIENDDDIEQMEVLCNALGDKKRLIILKELQTPPFKIAITDLARKLNVPITTLVHHVEVLEKAGLITINYKNDDKKNTRILGRKIRDIHLNLYRPVEPVEAKHLCETQEMRVGNYINFEGGKLLFATNSQVYVQREDYYYHPQRFNAEIIYTTFGVIEYYFDNFVTKKGTVEKLVLYIEICSEFPFYDMNHKSDITFWINNKEVTTYTCKGDYGDRRGKQNPDWWLDVNTQYGEMVTLSVDDKGVFINGTLMNDKITIKDLVLEKGNKISLKLGNKKTAKNPGGFNIFGKGFGDHAQDIVLQLYYKTTEK